MQGKRMGSGGPPGLQNRRSSLTVDGVFDSHALPPITLFRGQRGVHSFELEAGAAEDVELLLSEDEEAGLDESEDLSEPADFSALPFESFDPFDSPDSDEPGLLAPLLPA